MLAHGFFLGLFINIIYIFFRYQQTYYAITSENILIRTGFLTPKYKKLSISDVHSINLEINFFDKLVQPNNLAISYIITGEKTDEQILVSTHKCHQETAHTQFLIIRENAGTKGTVLARHLIQSFLPGETSPEIAHQFGIEFCKKILKNEYEFVLSTNTEKDHIHNHIIFNNVNMVMCKCYQSNKRNYHKIRH